MDNPNAFSMVFKKINYRFDVNGTSWVNGAAQNTMTLKEKGEGIIDIPISLSFFEMGQSVLDLLKGNNTLNCNFNGNFDLSTSLPMIGEVNLPFEKAGQVNLIK